MTSPGRHTEVHRSMKPFCLLLAGRELLAEEEKAWKQGQMQNPGDPFDRGLYSDAQASWEN